MITYLHKMFDVKRPKGVFLKETIRKYKEYENIILFEPLKLSQVRIENAEKTVNKGFQESLTKSFTTYKLKTPA